MQTSPLGIIEISAVPSALDLTPRGIAALANEWVHYHAALAELYN